MTLDTPHESAWPLLPDTAHLQAPEEFPPGPPPPSRRPVDGWGGAATRGLIATLASAGAAVLGLAISTATWTLTIGTTTPGGRDAAIGAMYGFMFAIVGAVPAALAAAVVGAPAGLLVGLAARGGGLAMARLLGIIAAAAVVLPVLVVSEAWPPFYGLLVTPVVAAVLSRWVVWAKEIPPNQLR